jgi:hypothetical protein
MITNNKTKVVVREEKRKEKPIFSLSLGAFL